MSYTKRSDTRGLNRKLQVIGHRRTRHRWTRWGRGLAITQEETIRNRADDHRDRKCRETEDTRDRDFKIRHKNSGSQTFWVVWWGPVQVSDVLLDRDAPPLQRGGAQLPSRDEWMWSQVHTKSIIVGAVLAVIQTLLIWILVNRKWNFVVKFQFLFLFLWTDIKLSIF